MIWAALALMTAVAAALLLAPLLRRSGEAAPRTAYDREIYRDQLAEVERDAQRGLIGETAAAAARTEIGRRLLASADRPDTPRKRFESIRTVIALAIAAPAAALALYLTLGAPQLATRIASPPPSDLSSLAAH